jgi:hypothetical protein
VSRKAIAQAGILAALAATVLILFLNHFEVDRFPEGLRGPPGPLNADAPSWLEDRLAHPCPHCGECAHLREMEECRLQVTVTDRDGWYRLFWAAPEVYIYDDPALVGGSLWNSTAELTGGTWRIRGRYVPEAAKEPHPCPAAVRAFDLKYRLRRGAYPGPGNPVLDPSGTLAVPGNFSWFSYRFPKDRQDDFWWELEVAPKWVSGPCDCGAPR